MASTINYWKVNDKIIKDNFIFTFIGDCFSIQEIRNKAIELYNTNKDTCDGIILRIIRTDAWDRPTNTYFLYYNGKKFIKDPEDIYFDHTEFLKSIENEHK